jgi:hypothetical protein
MSSNLKVKQGLSTTPQSVEDESGNPSSLALSTDNVGIGTTTPLGKLDVSGSIVLNGNVKTQLSATGDSTVLKGGLIVLDLSPVEGGQLQIGSSTSDNTIFLEGCSSDGEGNASAMRITGKSSQPLPKFTISALLTRFPGHVRIGQGPNFTLSPSDASPHAGYIRFGDRTGWKLHFARLREKSGGPDNNSTIGTLMTIQDNGNVGIGTTSPDEKLAVIGNIQATGDLIVQGVSFQLLLQRFLQLEKKVAALGSGSGSSGTVEQPFVSAGVEGTAGELKFLRIRGDGFQAGEEVGLKITTKTGSGNPFTETRQTTSTSLGSIDFRYSGSGGGICGSTPRTFQVQATGLSSSRQSNVANASC